MKNMVMDIESSNQRFKRTVSEIPIKSLDDRPLTVIDEGTSMTESKEQTDSSAT